MTKRTELTTTCQLSLNLLEDFHQSLAAISHAIPTVDLLLSGVTAAGTQQLHAGKCCWLLALKHHTYLGKCSISQLIHKSQIICHIIYCIKLCPKIMTLDEVSSIKLQKMLIETKVFSPLVKSRIVIPVSRICP